MLKTLVRLARGERPDVLRLDATEYVKVTRADRYSLRMPEANPHTDEASQEYRRQAALAILEEEETYGFVLLSIQKERPGSRIAIWTQIQPAWWPAIEQSLARVLRESRLLRAGR